MTAAFQIDQFLGESEKKTLLRFSTMGSVDDGKSTLIGRLLLDSENVYDDHLRALKRDSANTAAAGEEKALELALLTDGLRAEREQNITIDVAYRYFSTPKRNFILADTPGHEEYTRNMATGASTAQVALLVVDARKGIIQQTKRHSFIASLLGIPRMVVVINKMDLVDFSESVFQSIVEDFQNFSARLSVKNISFVPVAALHGDNVVKKSTRMPWYSGETILQYLENVYVGGDRNLVDFRFPIQLVLRPTQNFRGFSGKVSSGSLKVGEEVVALPSGRRSTVKSLHAPTPGNLVSNVDEICAGQSGIVCLTDEISLSRGDMLARAGNLPRKETRFEAMLVWMDHQPMDLGKTYLLQHTSRLVKARVEEIKYLVDIATLHRDSPKPFEMNGIGRVMIESQSPIFCDPYAQNRETGAIVLIDPMSNRTAAAGMIIERGRDVFEDESEGSAGAEAPSEKSTHISRDLGLVSSAERESRNKHAAATIWLTGLSGSGKSTISKALERRLFDEGQQVFRLDGDNLRYGLNRDLGFSSSDRDENIRRVAEVAKLMNEAGVTVICSFISPLERQRALAREIIGEGRFLEVYLSTSLEACAKRDAKGLYEKAKRGEIPGFTGVSSPYEEPLHPELAFSTEGLSVDSCIEKILKILA